LKKINIKKKRPSQLDKDSRLKRSGEGIKVGKQRFSSGLQFLIDFAKIFTIFGCRGTLTFDF
jgi:hypothetical protein